MLKEFAAMPRAIWLLCAGTFVNRFGSFVQIFVLLYLIRGGHPVARAGLAASGYGIGSICAAMLGGMAADRLGRRHTIVLSMGSSAVILMLLSAARPIWMIVPLIFLLGLSAELYRPASAALLADLTPAGERVTAFALYRLAINAGVTLGPATAGILAEHNFRWLFYGDAASSALFGLIAWFGLRGAESARPAPALRPAESRRPVLLQDRRLLGLFLAGVLSAFAYQQASTALPLHVTALGMSTAVVGVLLSLNAAIVLAIEVPASVITRRLPPVACMAAGFALIGIGMGATGLATAFLSLAATVLIWTIGEIAVAPVSSAYVADLAPDHLRGRYQAAWGLSSAVGMAMAPAVGGFLMARSPAALWWACAVSGIAGAAVVLAWGRTERIAAPALQPVCE
jgi:MFS family permease